MRALLLSFFLVACASSESPPVADSSTTATDSSVSDSVAIDSSELDAPADSGSEIAADATCSLVKPYSSKDKPCNDCAAEKCCAEVNGCLGDSRCDDDYVNCILACALLPDDGGDAGGCIADCGTMYPAGKSLYDAAIGCVESKCAICK